MDGRIWTLCGGDELPPPPSSGFSPPWPTDRQPGDIGWLHLQKPQGWRYTAASGLWWLGEQVHRLAAWIDD